MKSVCRLVGYIRPGRAVVGVLWLLLTWSVALGADLEVSAKGKPVIVFLDGERLGMTPVSFEVGAGIHELTAKEDELSAAALNLKFAVFDQLDGRIRLDWKKQVVDLMWPGEERLSARDRALLRNRELALASQPGMFALPPAANENEIKSASDLTFTREVRLVGGDEFPSEDDSEEALFGELGLLPADDASEKPPRDEFEVPDDASADERADELNLDFLDSERAPAEGDDVADEIDFDSISFGPLDLNEIDTEEPVTAEVEADGQLPFDDLLGSPVEDEEDQTLVIAPPPIEPIREKRTRLRETRSGLPPWVVGTGAAVVAGGFYWQAGLQWTMAQGYAERARNMEGSVAGVAEYEFNVDYAKRKSGLTRASIGIGTAVLASGIGVTVALGKR